MTYDSCYRRKAVITKSLDWGQVHFTLYNETFTGRAKPIPRCKFCLSEHHISSECTYAPEMPSTNQSQSQSVCTMTLGSHTPQFVISSTTRWAIYATLTHTDLVMSVLFAETLTQPHSAGPGHHHPSCFDRTHQQERDESR